MTTLAEIDAELARRQKITDIDAELAKRGFSQQRSSPNNIVDPIVEPQGNIKNDKGLTSFIPNQNILPDAVSGTIKGVGEAVTQLAGSLAGTAIGGVQMLLPDAVGGGVKGGQETIKSIHELVSPKTDQGKFISENVSSALSQIGKIPAGWAGIASLLGGNSIDSAVKTVKEVEKKGIGKVAGDIVLEKTGSPFLATLTESSPTIAAMFVPAKLAASKIIKDVSKSREFAAAERFSNIDTLKKGDPNNLLEDFRLVNRDKWSKPTKSEIKVMSEKLNSDTAFAEKYIKSLPEIAKLKTGKSAVAQEWDPSVLGLAKTGTLEDITVMQKQLNIYKKGVKDLESKIGNRPIFEAGKAINDQVKFFLNKKKDAGQRVAIEAKKLKGLRLNFGPIIDNFIKKLEDEGVVFNGGEAITNLKDYNRIDFRRSLFGGSKNSEDILRSAIKRMTATDYAVDGFDLHNLKQSLPFEITTTKNSSRGLIPKAELALNNLRREVNTLLKNNSPNYKKANEDYQAAIEPLNKLNDALPLNSKIDWTGINPDKAGLQSRKIMSNYASAIDMADALLGLTKESKKLGGNFNSSAIKQTIFAAQLDKRLGAFADQTFQGIQEAAQKNVIGSIPLSGKDVGKLAIRQFMRKIKSIDNKKAIKAMEDYLNEIKISKKFETKPKKTSEVSDGTSLVQKNKVNTNMVNR